LDAKDGPIVLPAKVKFVEWLILKSGTLTDQEIKERIVHNKDWSINIDQLFKNTKKKL